MLETIKKDLIKRYSFELKKRKGYRYKCRRMVGALSIFSIPNGIYHKNEIKYDSRSSHIGSVLLLMFITVYFVIKFQDLNKITGFNSYIMFMTYGKEF